MNAQGTTPPSTITLPNGRSLAYAEYGDAGGTPVFHCNGSGGSRLEWPGDPAMLREIGVRFIAIDRPGHGFSDHQPDRTLLDWPGDLAALADHLEIDRFHIEGWSAGGPYALASAHQLPERVIAGAVLSGLGPFDRPCPYDGLSEPIKTWMMNARDHPERVYPFRATMAQALIERPAAQVGAMLSAGHAEDDRAVARRPDLQALMGMNIKEGYRQGPKGPAQDDIIINSAWGFRLQDIQTRIDLWQGEVDRNVPLVQGQHQHSVLPNSTLRVLKNTAHLFPLVRWKEILLELIRP